MTIHIHYNTTIRCMCVDVNRKQVVYSVVGYIITKSTMSQARTVFYILILVYVFDFTSAFNLLEEVTF